MNLDKEIALKLFNDESMLWSRDFRPSTSIKHAMEVESEMFRRGYTITIVRYLDGGFGVEFKSGAVEMFKSLPEAICRAALAALKSE